MTDYNPIHPGRGGPQKGLIAGEDAALGRSTKVFRNKAASPLFQREGACEGAQVATIHCQVSNVIYPTNPATGRRMPVTGLLLWGQGAARFEAKIDLRTGV